jgi:hypothetical protein
MLVVIIGEGQRRMPGVVKLLVFACLSRKWPEKAAYAGAGSKVNGYSVVPKRQFEPRGENKVGTLRFSQ